MDVKYGSPRNVTEVNEQTAGRTYDGLFAHSRPRAMPLAPLCLRLVKPNHLRIKTAWLLSGADSLQTCFVSQSLTALPFSWIFTQSFSVACCESLFPAQASESRIIIRANALASRSVGYPEQWLIIARLNYPTAAGKSALKSPHNKCHRLLEKLQH